MLAPTNSVSFVTNHDTERNGMHMSYKDGDTYKLANVFQLAYKWSTPTVYSGFEFSSSDQAPPNSNGFVTDTNCSSGWYCLQRDTAITGMVKWHHAVGSESVAISSTKSSNVIGFGRGTASCVAINNGSSTVTVSGGNATLTIPAKSAIAFYDGEFTPCDTACEEPDDGTATVTAASNEYAPTTSGQDVYVVGSIAALGNWDTSKAVKLSSSGYPVRSGA